MKEISIEKFKYLLIAAAVVLFVSNAITVYAIIRHKTTYKELQDKSAAVTKTLEETFNSRYKKLLDENRELKKTISELQKSAEKWNIYEERYQNNSRSGVDRNEANIPGAIKKKMRITAYTEFECDKEPDHPAFRITTSGNEVEEWFTVAAGPEIPFGTRIYIPHFKDYENNGIFVVEDRGGSIKENCIDVYIANQETVDKFGVKYLDVYILD